MVEESVGLDGCLVDFRLVLRLLLEPVLLGRSMFFKPSTCYNLIDQAKVIAIHKKNSKVEPGNYRQVFILCIISTIFERVECDN